MRERHDAVVMRSQGEVELDEDLAQPARGQLGTGNVPEQPALAGTKLTIWLRKTPDRRALEDRQMLDDRRDRGDDLNSRAAGADHRDPLARHGSRMIPAGRVHLDALEVVEALNVGQLRLRERALGSDDEARRYLLTGVERQPP